MASPRRRVVVSANAANTLSSAVEVDEFTTLVIVPTAFKLTLDNGQEVHYQDGQQPMPTEHFAHWFTRAMGVVEAPAAADDFPDTEAA